MNRNEIIGTAIGKTLGYAFQGYIISEIAKRNYSASFIINSTKYWSRIPFASKGILLNCFMRFLNSKNWIGLFFI